MLTPCPHCKDDHATVRYDLGAAQILRCTSCELLYIHPWPSRENTETVYSDTYFANHRFLQGDGSVLYGYVDYIAERFNKQPQYASIARTIRSLVVPGADPPRLLEVGCGLGYFLSEAFEENFSVSGVEFNRFAVDRLRQKYAFPIYYGALESIDLKPASYDVVAMFDVIEHLRDPFTCLDKLRDALAPGGLLVLSTPDAESWVSRLLGDRLEDFRRTREHLFFFGRRTMRAILNEHGFDVLSIRSIGHTFDLAILLDRLALYNRPFFKTIRRFVDWIGLGSLQIRVNPLTKMIVLARRAGNRPFAAGAPALPESATPEEATSELDRVLVHELETLERAAPRNYQWIFDVIAPYLGRSVLEVGSGVGVISKMLVPRCENLILSDCRPIYLRKLRERFGDLPNLTYRILDLNERPYDLGGAKSDTIVCLNVLEHIENDLAVLRGLHELLPTGGRLILQVPNHPRLFGSLDESYGHFRRYDRKGLQDVLRNAGFDDMSIRCFNPFSIPGWFLSSKVLRAKRLNVAWLRAYDALVPLLRCVDMTSRVTGLALIALAEKR